MNAIAKIALGAISFLSIIILYSNELTWLNNTFDRNTLLLTAVVIGILIGLAVSYKLVKGKDYESLENFQVFLGVTILVMVITPLFFSLSNRLFTFHSMQNEKVTFIKSSAFKTSRYGNIPQENPDGYYTYIIRKGELKRIYSSSPIYDNALEGQKISMPIQKGLFGFSVAYPNRLPH